MTIVNKGAILQAAYLFQQGVNAEQSGRFMEGL